MESTAAGQPHLVRISEAPIVRESRLAALDSFITPVDRFFVRNHFADVPEVDINDWRLRVDGEVSVPLELDFERIMAMNSRESVVTLECAGNSRSHMRPPAEGISFSHGAVSAAKWRGVPLLAILDAAGVKDGAVEVAFHGSDVGEEEEEGEVFEDLPYVRSLPLNAALSPDNLLAYEMNGAPLTPDHGFPLRLVAPRWYGMASVKWLKRIQVLDRPYDGFFQNRRYVFINEGPEKDIARREPVTTIKVKSNITTPRHGEIIPPGPIVIRGFAWSGNGEVTRVEVSDDAGETWGDAELKGEADVNCWRRWEFPWTAKEPGHFIFMSRATDSTGARQERESPWNFRGYANNAIQSLAVETPGSRAGA